MIVKCYDKNVHAQKQNSLKHASVFTNTFDERCDILFYFFVFYFRYITQTGLVKWAFNILVVQGI